MAKIYVLGYVPILLVMITMVVFGFLEENDDIRLKRIRQKRHDTMDRELGLKNLPGRKAKTEDSKMSDSSGESEAAAATTALRRP